MENKFVFEQNRVFEIFKTITGIPRGSKNMGKIADFCEEFAIKNQLKYIRDKADNVIIFKPASKGFEEKPTVILQGHLDMVCQKTFDSNHDFSISGPEILTDGDFLKAYKTSLGADNGIAVAIIMMILESKNLKHPSIEAVFTTDEEIGMVGALQLDTGVLKGKYLINLDSEDDDTVTVSCAGGSEIEMNLPINKEKQKGLVTEIKLFGLKGGHSGVEIDKGRVNANILAGRVLNHIYDNNFNIVCVNGGDKSNAITFESTIKFVSNNDISEKICDYLKIIKNEISFREPDFDYSVNISSGEALAIDKESTEKLISILNIAPNGIINMSAEIEGLVETSLNLGVLKTENDFVNMNFALRSNKKSALEFLEEKLILIAKLFDAKISAFGHYPPWEYNQNNKLQEIYCKCFEEYYGFKPKIEAIHAGLECGVFTSKISNLSCIAVGPQMYDVHTVNERLSISSTKKFIQLLLVVLEKL